MDKDYYHPFQPTLTKEGQKYFGLDLILAKPCLSLASDIFAFVEVSVQKPTMYPVIPDGTNILFFSSSSSIFGGSQSAILDVPLIGKGVYFGIWFNPGKLRNFFNLDVSESRDRLIGLDFLENRHFLHMKDDLYDLPTFRDRVAYCEKLLFKHTEKYKISGRFEQAKCLINRNRGMLSIADLAEKVGLSQRQLNRHFQLNTGLTTKHFSQLVRINHYLRHCYFNRLSYLENGLDFGFYDQSHIIKTVNQHRVNRLSDISRKFMTDFYKPKMV